jgi:hypothetical protein
VRKGSHALFSIDAMLLAKEGDCGLSASASINATNTTSTCAHARFKRLRDSIAYQRKQDKWLQPAFPSSQMAMTGLCVARPRDVGQHRRARPLRGEGRLEASLHVVQHASLLQHDLHADYQVAQLPCAQCA